MQLVETQIDRLDLWAYQWRVAYKYPDPPRRRARANAVAKSSRARETVIVTTKVADEFRDGAKGLSNMAHFLDKGGFFEEAKRTAAIADDVLNLARTIELKISSYARAVREGDDFPLD